MVVVGVACRQFSLIIHNPWQIRRWVNRYSLEVIERLLEKALVRPARTKAGYQQRQQDLYSIQGMILMLLKPLISRVAKAYFLKYPRQKAQ